MAALFARPTRESLFRKIQPCRLKGGPLTSLRCKSKGIRRRGAVWKTPGGACDITSRENHPARSPEISAARPCTTDRPARRPCARDRYEPAGRYAGIPALRSGPAASGPLARAPARTSFPVPSRRIWPGPAPETSPAPRSLQRACRGRLPARPVPAFPPATAPSACRPAAPGCRRRTGAGTAAPLSDGRRAPRRHPPAARDRRSPGHCPPHPARAGRRSSRTWYRPHPRPQEPERPSRAT